MGTERRGGRRRRQRCRGGWWRRRRVRGGAWWCTFPPRRRACSRFLTGSCMGLMTRRLRRRTVGETCRFWLWSRGEGWGRKLRQVGERGRVEDACYHRDVHLCCSAHKNKNWGQTMPKCRCGTTSTTVIVVHDIPQFCHNPGVTANRKPHHPAIGFEVLSLQCGKAAAVLGACKQRDSVAEFENMVRGRWIFSLLYCGQVIFLLLQR